VAEEGGGITCTKVADDTTRGNGDEELIQERCPRDASRDSREHYHSGFGGAGEASSWCGFGICDKDATKSRKGGGAKCLT
jgi:hypothetical protein